MHLHSAGVVPEPEQGATCVCEAAQGVHVLQFTDPDTAPPV
jgi:hypothetical protein